MPPDLPPLSLSLLGTPVLRRKGDPVTGRAAYRRRIALLAVLAAARGRPVGRERLMGLLWPEQSEEGARHSLSESLYVLRRELGGGVAAVGSDVALDPAGLPTDLEAFERALEEGRPEDAVRAYGGPFLDGFYVDGAPEFERWAQGERDRLARAFARVVEALAEAAEDADDPLRAAGWWRRLAAHDPYSSRVALRLARALARGGEGAAALRHVEAHAAFLQAELGVGPGAELSALVERLRSDAAPLPPRPVPAPPAEPADSADSGDSGDSGDSVEPRTRMAAGTVPPPDDAADPGVPAPDGHAAVPPAPVARRERLAARARRRIGAALLAAAGAAAVFLSVRGDTDERKTALDPHRIAVLYFDDHSAGGELAYLAAGLTESLIHELSQVEALQVVSRNGVKPFRQGTVPLDSVAARLRAGSLVEGSVQRTGDSVRVTVQLIDAGSLAHLESRSVVRSLDEVLALQGELVEEVAGALRRRLGRELRLRQARDGAGSARALEAVLRAEQLRADAGAVMRDADPRDAGSALRLLARADSLLAAAEAESPRWARPTLARGWVALQAAEVDAPARRAERVAAAAASADRALARDPASPEALELRGRAAWRGALATTGAAEARLAAAERDLRAAVAAEPARASAWGVLSQVLLARGRFGEAEVAARRALEADAYLEEAPVLLLRLYFAALGRADHPAAWDACGRGARMFPLDWQFVDCRLTLLRADASRPPRPGEAWRLVTRLDTLDPPAAARAAGRGYAPVYRRMVAAAVSARAGDADSARAVLARALREVQGDPEDRVSLKFDEAYLRVLLGDRAGARARLREYVAARPALRAYVDREPVLRGLLSPPPPAAP